MAERSHSIWHLLVVGLVFHLVFIGTVFDCYFTSPVVHGMRSFGLEKADAKRLVLIVADGLRADLLFNLNPFPNVPDSPEVVAPYLRSIALERGAFGVSHTRVPTESRPGHVALIGGMYEDVSAVTKGWKTNPVDFDSVFNRSSHTYSFGSPDILPMFSKGATPGKVEMWCYHEDEEDFTKDATALDVWVLDHLRTLFHNATSDPLLHHQLQQGQSVFFLHLLGLDTTGHSYRPHSKEYMVNIQIVDEIIRQTELLFTEFYKDHETAFVFTADHGMSRIGNHGDGDPDNTRTPLIAWGKGVRGPLPDTVPSSHDAYSNPWGLSHLSRRDVEQADVAALMATLIGTEWPVNSVGVLPDVDVSKHGYLSSDGNGEKEARAAVVNAKVILEHYKVKHEEKKSHAVFYKPFPQFAHSDDADNRPGSEYIAEIETLLERGSYSAVRSLCAQLIKTTLEGLRYLQTYDRTLIRSIVSVAYLGWMAFGAVSIFLPQQEPARSLFVDVAAGAVLLACWGLFTLQHSPWSLYVYACFPTYFWHKVAVLARAPVYQALQDTQKQSLHLATVMKWLLWAAAVIAALESMVAGYLHRSIWSIGFVIMGVVWPLISWPKDMFSSRNLKVLLGWVLACLTTAVFPLLPVEKHENITEILAGGACMLLAGIVGAISVPLPQEARYRFRSFVAFQCILIVLSMVITASSASSLQAKAGLPRLNQIAGWVVFLTASVLPFTRLSQGYNHPVAKILMFFLAFSVCFVILSISVEGLFYVAFSTTLLLWVEVESSIRQASSDGRATGAIVYRPQADDVRIALFFLFFVQVAFFGTGNVASISSFYLEPVYRLVPVFNPFLMAVLLMFKIVVPYIILATTLHLLNRRLHLPPFSLFLVALTITDVMTMTFFFNVTDTGSWLEIGQTISFFCISSLLLVWAAGTCAVGDALMADTVPIAERTKQD